jgi:hypothetical protein
MSPHLLPLVDALQKGPKPEIEFAAELVEEGIAAGIITKFKEDVTKLMHLSLTGKGVEQALAARKDGALLFNLDITPIGVQITGPMTREQYVQNLQRFKLVQETYHAALADFRTYGRRQFGTEFVDEAFTQLEFALHDVQKADAIAQVPFLLRDTYRLTTEHYYVLGKIFPGDSDEQQRWAELAKKHSLTALALKRSIEADPSGNTIMTDTTIREQSGHGSGGIPVIEGIITVDFQRWKNHVGGEEKILRFPRPAKEKLLEELRPAAELYEKVMASLE